MLPLRSLGNSDDNRPNAAAILVMIRKSHEPSPAWHRKVAHYDEMKSLSNSERVDWRPIDASLPQHLGRTGIERCGKLIIWNFRQHNSSGICNESRPFLALKPSRLQ